MSTFAHLQMSSRKNDIMLLIHFSYNIIKLLFQFFFIMIRLNWIRLLSFTDTWDNNLDPEVSA